MPAHGGVWGGGLQWEVGDERTQTNGVSHGCSTEVCSSMHAMPCTLPPSLTSRVVCWCCAVWRGWVCVEGLDCLILRVGAKERGRIEKSSSPCPTMEACQWPAPLASLPNQ